VPNDVVFDCVNDLGYGETLGDRIDLGPSITGSASAEDSCGYWSVDFYDSPADWESITGSACGIEITRTWVATSRCGDVVNVDQTISFQCNLNCGRNGSPSSDCTYCNCNAPWTGQFCEKTNEVCDPNESYEDHQLHFAVLKKK